MTYAKPNLRPLAPSLDLAACKPAPPPRCPTVEVEIGPFKVCLPSPSTQPGCPGLHVSNLCFAQKSIVVVRAEGAPIAAATQALPAPPEIVLPAILP